MGRGKNKADASQSWRSQNDSYGSRWSGGGSQQHASWSLWPGSWKQSPRPKQRADKPDAFPAYDTDWQHATEIMEISSTQLRRPTTANGGLVQDVQQAINQARKQEHRLQKLQRESLQRGQAWDAWVLKMRASYAKEHDRHQKEQKRLATEIKEAEELTLAAYSQVQDAALRQQRAALAAPPPPMEWESAMEVEDSLTEEQQREELKRMLARADAARAPKTPRRGTGAAPITPPGSASAESLMEISTPPPASADSYPSPPGLSAPTPPVETAAVRLDPREPAMEAPSQGQSALAGKLSERRRSLRKAMEPFGLGRPVKDVPPSDAPAVPDGATAPASHPTANNQVPNPLDPGGRLLDDDPDELATARSPGFGSLE